MDEELSYCVGSNWARSEYKRVPVNFIGCWSVSMHVRDQMTARAVREIKDTFISLA